MNNYILVFSLNLQKLTTSVVLRPLSDASTDLKKVLAEKIPKEQERVKAFRKSHGSTKVGEVTVDMVSIGKKFVQLTIYAEYRTIEMHRGNAVDTACPLCDRDKRSSSEHRLISNLVNCRIFLNCQILHKEKSIITIR